MADDNAEIFKGQILAFAQEVYHFITNNIVSGETWGRLAAVCLLLAILLVVGYLFFKALTTAIEGLIKLSEAYKNSSLALVIGTEKKRNIRRRQQFCSVLDADLAYMAKAENWNDQYFTDLEAEVETEGGYYISAVDKLRKKKFAGIRRVSSLISAIDSSSERTILLVGDPGSGKSVALRHLAKQLAGRGRNSKNQKIIIPLYLNLRELEAAPGISIDADLIKQFVSDNIRRGDADTSTYVRENWQNNKENGIWFFLFDSFDEIPDVLHAATGSPAVRQYSQAIRQFLDGMGECRSVLASREYKGPEALPWKKFRILPLGSERQSELVKNSFLDADQIELVHQHLATDRSKLGNNPLFLTLLCRYVKDEGAQPVNDHQLLTSHIERLASREPEYILKKYHLTSQQLIEGARTLAVAFAENSALSLAPKIDEIYSVLEDRFSLDQLQSLISALVDVKIGRNDVATARQGDRRFAFSHRRYQETLFANFLASNPTYISPVDLLLEPQWREYSVTLLQTQSVEAIFPILQAATNILVKRSLNQVKLCRKQIGQYAIGYFDWSTEPFIRILEILQEGLARRLIDVPDELSTAIFHLLEPRWTDGDYYDRYMAIKLGGLLPEVVLTRYLRVALEDELTELGAIAFKQCVYLRDASLELNRLIRKKLATEALSARDTVSRLRLEALAAQLPTAVGASYVTHRCLMLRPLLSKLSKVAWVVSFQTILLRRILVRLGIVNLFTQSLDRRMPTLQYKGGDEWVFAFIVFPIPFFMRAVQKIFNPIFNVDSSHVDNRIHEFVASPYFWFTAIIYVAFFGTLLLMYKNRVEGVRLKFSTFFTKEQFISVGGVGLRIILMVASVSLLGLFPWILGNGIYFFLSLIGIKISVASRYMEIGLPTCLVLVLIASLAMMCIGHRNSKRRMRRLEELRKIPFLTSDTEILLNAESFSEALVWLNRAPTFLIDNDSDIRTASALLLALPLALDSNLAEHFPLLKASADPSSRQRVTELVGRRVLSMYLEPNVGKAREVRRESGIDTVPNPRAPVQPAKAVA
ncbi:NACHT domain-containing protein [Glaciimonas immobilis]|uniref:NACHT domain-containing protein n=1 Tax=Glaciimonas immobilis TaxID=728004 RepID=A0A840RY90_9BURK|nr:NACHT domain-containing protein [Glaciimonas immobilis]KAF3998513.1 NACHT domain-containing protein [Glaciimonas immobilis]MBB5201359.1 hypothetical protein [Glaciimonas immobilis]